MTSTTTTITGKMIIVAITLLVVAVQVSGAPAPALGPVMTSPTSVAPTPGSLAPSHPAKPTPPSHPVGSMAPPPPGGRVAPAPGPMVVQTPGGPVASAPGPGGLDCLTPITNMSDCLTYVDPASNLTKPDEGCCGELAGLVESQPTCLCELLAGNVTKDLGIEINLNKALKLPSVCGVQTPPISTCSLIGYPVPMPPSEAPSAPAAAPPESGSNNNGPANVAAYVQPPILVGLAIACLITLIF